MINQGSWKIKDWSKKNIWAFNQDANDKMHSLHKMWRFATEVAGVPEIGAIGRGENMEITTYLEKAMGQSFPLTL